MRQLIFTKKYNMLKNVAIYLGDADNEGIGLGEFENHIAIQLSRKAEDVEKLYGVKLFFIVKPEMAGKYGDKVEYITVRRKKGPFRRMYADNTTQRIDLLHLTHQGVKLKFRRTPLTLMTVHDVNFFHNNISRFRIWRKTLRTRRQLALATHLSFISHFTEHDVKAHFRVDVPSKVIYNGVTDLSARPGKMPAMALPSRYFLHISRLAEKKNVHLLVKMMKYLPGENLVIAGRGRKDYEKKLKDIIAAEGLDNVYLTGSVSLDEKTALLGGCRALLFPSKSEGFGLPVVEAMCFGKPVFLSALTSLPEIGGKEACYFDRLNPEAMAATMTKGMADFDSDSDAKSMRIKARAAMFDWNKTADAFIEYYVEMLKKGKEVKR